jgi:hypothetical protein
VLYVQASRPKSAAPFLLKRLSTSGHQGDPGGFLFSPEEDMSRPHTVCRSAPLWVFTIVLAINAVPSQAATPNKSATPPAGATRVIVDEASETVRIVVGGETVALFDRKGLHVVGGIDYTGALGPGTYTVPADLPTPAAGRVQHGQSSGKATKDVRIVVDGKDVAVFDSKGLHVHGNLDSSGALQLPLTGSADAPSAVSDGAVPVSGDGAAPASSQTHKP